MYPIVDRPECACLSVSPTTGPPIPYIPPEHRPPPQPSGLLRSLSPSTDVASTRPRPHRPSDASSPSGPNRGATPLHATAVAIACFEGATATGNAWRQARHLYTHATNDDSGEYRGELGRGKDGVGCGVQGIAREWASSIAVACPEVEDSRTNEPQSCK